MVEPVACIFPHSDKEFCTPDELRSFLCDKLPRQKKGRYLLGKLGYKDKDFKAKVIRGSLVLFRKKGCVVGQATVQNAILELRPPKEDKTEKGIPMTYYHAIVFDPLSIKVCKEAISVEALKRWSGKKLYPQFYSILGTRRDYEEHFHCV